MSALIYGKMSAVMKEIGFVGKDQKNQAQGFKFRGIDQFVNTLYPALTKHGVFMTPRCTSYTHEVKDVTRSNGKAGVDKHVAILMEYDFFAEDGSKVTVGPVPAEGLDSGDKATNKALSAGLKYALIQTFSVPTEDMAEADLESPELGAPSASPNGVAASKTEHPTHQIVDLVSNDGTVTTVLGKKPETKVIRKPASFARTTPVVEPITGKKVEAVVSTVASTADGWES